MLSALIAAWSLPWVSFSVPDPRAMSGLCAFRSSIQISRNGLSPACGASSRTGPRMRPSSSSSLAGSRKLITLSSYPGVTGTITRAAPACRKAWKRGSTRSIALRIGQVARRAQ